MGLQGLKTKILSQPEAKKYYESLQPEFDAAKILIALRQQLQMTQRELAAKAGIKQPQLARLESGKQSPRLETLAEIAASVGYQVEIKLVPIQPQQSGLQVVENL